MAALIAALVLGLVNTLIRPIFVVLTLPVTVLTLGLFILVINGLMFWFAGSILRGFDVDSFWHGVLGAVAVQHYFLGAVDVQLPSQPLVMKPWEPATPISFEFFPPQTPEGVGEAAAARQQLARSSRNSFPSPSARAAPRRTARWKPSRRSTPKATRRHRTCPASARRATKSAHRCARYKAMGIRTSSRCAATCLRAWRGIGEFHYANELVSFIRAQTGDQFHIEVAAYPEFHPQTRNAARRRHAQLQAQGQGRRQFGHHAVFLQRGRLLPLRRRVPQARRSASRSCPASCRSCNFSQLARFSDTCGAEIPRWMRTSWKAIGDDSASIHAFGLDVVTALCEKLLAAARRACTSTR